MLHITLICDNVNVLCDILDVLNATGRSTIFELQSVSFLALNSFCLIAVKCRLSDADVKNNQMMLQDIMLKLQFLA